MPQSRAEDLNYYDELGVARDASPDQLREAFRSLVRILHPDHQVEEHLKAVAELQMRKLNRIYAVLADPLRRREYDQQLNYRPAAPPPPPPPEEAIPERNPRDLSRYAWLGAAIVIMGGLLWFAADSSAGSTTAAERADAAARQIDNAPAQDYASSYIAQLRSDLRLARAERDSAMRELSALRSATSSRGPVTVDRMPRPAVEPKLNDAGLPTPVPSLADPPATASPATLPATPSLVSRTPSMRQLTRPFGGFWFFVKGQEDKKNSQLYPPEFIEATIVEQNGMVRGHYRSRYRIVDRDISPDVTFDFNGTVNLASNTVTADWTGPGGARGELVMKLVGEHSMKVDWSADRLGTIQGLTSGTASLTRRLDQ